MGEGELRPAALAALRRHRWAAVGLAVGGILVAGGMSTLLLLLADKRADDPATGNGGPGPTAGVIVFLGVWMAWQGFVVYPRDNKALRSPGRRVALRPVFSSRRESRVAWLVAEEPTSSHALAIPVDPLFADRAVGGTAAVVRGRLQPGGRVALDFPGEVAFPLGPVELLPKGLPEHATPAQVYPNGPMPSQTSVVWRVALGLSLVFLGIGAFVDGVDVGDRPCGSIPHALTDAPFQACVGEARFQLAAAIACTAGGGYLLWRAWQRLNRRRIQPS